MVQSECQPISPSSNINSYISCQRTYRFIFYFFNLTVFLAHLLINWSFLTKCFGAFYISRMTKSDIFQAFPGVLPQIKEPGTLGFPLLHSGEPMIDYWNICYVHMYKFSWFLHFRIKFFILKIIPTKPVIFLFAQM